MKRVPRLWRVLFAHSLRSYPFLPTKLALVSRPTFVGIHPSGFRLAGSASRPVPMLCHFSNIVFLVTMQRASLRYIYSPISTLSVRSKYGKDPKSRNGFDQLWTRLCCNDYQQNRLLNVLEQYPYSSEGRPRTLFAMLLSLRIAR